MRGAVVFFMCVTSALAVVGCGNAENTPTVTTAAIQETGEEPTKAEWISKADAICRSFEHRDDDLKKKYEEIADEDLSDESFSRAAEVLRELIDVARPRYEALRQIDPPAPEKEAVARLLATGEGSLLLGEQLAEAMDEGDYSDIDDAADELRENSAKADGMADGYGLKVCGKDSR